MIYEWTFKQPKYVERGNGNESVFSELLFVKFISNVFSPVVAESIKLTSHFTVLVPVYFINIFFLSFILMSSRIMGWCENRNNY